MDRYGNPVPRRYYALVANMLCENGASAVVLDRVFEARNELEGVAGGKMLSSVLKRHNNIISAWWAPLRKTQDTRLKTQDIRQEEENANLESSQKAVYSTDSPIVPLRFAMPHNVDEIGISPYETSLHREEVSLPYDEALQA
jgi:hypothetical protein